jgi:2-keto-3-deoxy-L-rhamnonate aldolase RhmA
MIVDSTLKAMTRSRDLRLGHFIVEFVSPGIGHILRAAGCDYAMLDMEHSGFGIETVKTALRYFEAANLPTVVRVPSNAYHHIASACDMGAEGIMVPVVSTAEETRQIVDSMKYAPQGHRGVALGVAHDRYVEGPVGSKLVDANDRTTLFILIETAEGVENVDAIAGVPGVDCLHIGHYDLSVSLGIPGDFKHSRFQQAVEQVAQAGRRHDRALGQTVESVERAVEAFAAGFNMLLYSGDAWLFRTALASALAEVRAATKGSE